MAEGSCGEDVHSPRPRLVWLPLPPQVRDIWRLLRPHAQQSVSPSRSGWDAPTSTVLSSRTGEGRESRSVRLRVRVSALGCPRPPARMLGGASASQRPTEVRFIGHLPVLPWWPAHRCRQLASLLPTLTGLCGLRDGKASCWREEERGAGSRCGLHTSSPMSSVAGTGQVHRDCTRDKWQLLVALRGGGREASVINQPGEEP